MKKRQRQGRRQREEARIRLDGGIPPTPTAPPSVLKAPVSPDRGFLFAALDAAGSAVHVAEWGAGHTGLALAE
jgi:hypothetical protein